MAINFQDWIKKAVLVIGVAMSLFHIYVLGINPIDTWIFRAMHVMFAMILIILLKPTETTESKKGWGFLWDFFLIALCVITSLYIALNVQRLVLFLQFDPSTTDAIICAIGVFLVLETTRKVNGLTMPLLAAFFLVYALFGQYIPGVLGHKGYGLIRLVSYSYSLDGVFGVSIGVSATYMILFVIFGAVLEGTGGGRLFIEMATSAFGGVRGGPAKAAIFASAGMGTMSGSSAGNVVTTGAFTIPLMKKIGYNPRFAGAVEAVASTGGQIMPPVMGAGAFIMAESIGMPYLSIAAAAVIPALLYFLSVYVMVDIEALKTGLTGLPKDQLPNKKKILAEVGHLIIPLLVLLYYLIIDRSTPIKAGLYGIYASLIVGMLRKTTRYNIKKLLDMLADGARSSISVVSACACAGLIIGVLTLTGLGTKIAGIIVALSGGNLLLALLLTMLVTIFLGMGLPTTAAYIVTSSVVAPALINLGIIPIAAHLFIFYFACLSAITPPVAIAAYAAAGLSGANPNTTGFTAFRLGLAAFIVPYMFVFSNALLMQDSWLIVLRASITAIIGTIYFAHAISGWLTKKANFIVRILLLAAALLLIDQAWLTDITGAIVIAACYLLQEFVFKSPLKKAEEKTA